MATYKTKKPYMYGTGRRKSSVARVHLIPNGSGVITVNGRDIDDYFGLETLKLITRQPLALTDLLGKVDVVATVTGGGVTGQPPWARSTSKPPSRAAAFPARPAPSATASPAPSCWWTRATAPS